MRKDRTKVTLKEVKEYNATKKQDYKDNLKQIGLDEIFLEAPKAQKDLIDLACAISEM